MHDDPAWQDPTLAIYIEPGLFNTIREYFNVPRVEDLVTQPRQGEFTRVVENGIPYWREMQTTQ